MTVVAVNMLKTWRVKISTLVQRASWRKLSYADAIANISRQFRNFYRFLKFIQIFL